MVLERLRAVLQLAQPLAAPIAPALVQAVRVAKARVAPQLHAGGRTLASGRFDQLAEATRQAALASGLSVVTYGLMVHRSVGAAEVLHQEDGFEVEVLDLRTLSPLDDEAIVESVKKTGRLLVVHEDTRTGGIAGEIAMRVSEKAFEWLDAPMLRVTAIDAPVPYAAALEDYFLPQTEDIVTAARYLAAY